VDCYGYVNDDDDDGDDGDDDDDDDEIAPDAKVSFFNVFQRFVVPRVKCLKSDNSGGPLRCPAPCFSMI